MNDRTTVKKCMFGHLTLSSPEKTATFDINALGRFSRIGNYELSVLAKSGRSSFDRVSDCLLLDPIACQYAELFRSLKLRSLGASNTDLKEQVSIASDKISMRKKVSMVHLSFIAICFYMAILSGQWMSAGAIYIIGVLGALTYSMKEDHIQKSALIRRFYPS